MVAQALRGTDQRLGDAVARGVELARLQPADPIGAATAGPCQPLDHGDLCGAVHPPDELGRGVAGDVVVESPRGLGGEDEAEAVLTGL